MSDVLQQLQLKVAMKKPLEGRSLANYFFQVIGRLDDMIVMA